MKSLGQTGKINNDSIRCYGITELQHIAAGLVAGKACDSMLKISNFKLELKNATVREKDFQISKLNSENKIKDNMLASKDTTITNITHLYKREVRRHKTTKFTLGGGMVVLGVTVLYLIFH